MNAPPAKEIMVTKLVTLPPDAEVLEAIRLLIKHSISGTPVVEGDGKYCGVFSEKSCMRLFHAVIGAAEAQGIALPELPEARQIMSAKLVTLLPTTDVVNAISNLLKNHISGAPVVDASNRFVGVFSEKNSMSVLIQAAYEQLPSSEVSAFMNTDFGRTIFEHTSFLHCVEMFLETSYRRLPVLRDGTLVGQVSRRDVLLNAAPLTALHQDGSVKLDVCPEAAEKGRRIACVRDFMDTHARTITEEVDLLELAQIFLHTPYRRLPVLRDGKLVGQISRRDVLMATHRMLEFVPQRESSLLYLSALVEKQEILFHQ